MAAELFGPSDVPKTVGIPDFRSLDLTAEEGFLLSRIDGRTNVQGLLSLVSWDRQKTFELLESLLRKHLVNFDRAEILAAVNGPAVAPVAPEAASRPPPAAAPAIDRAAMEKVPDLDEERCVEILEWEHRARNAATLYELFGIPDGADVRSVKREYRQLAMKFHPDKFFRKEIGGYRARIDECWKRVQEAYEKLTTPEQKAAYDAEILARGPRPTLAPKPAAGDAPSAASPARAATSSPEKPWMAPPPPPAPGSAQADGGAPAGGAQPLPQVPEVEPRPRWESAFERKIKQEVRERLEKAQRHFEQAQVDYKDKKYVSADSNAKMALQFDPKNADYQKWYDSVRPMLEESIVSSVLRKGELAELSHDSKAALEAYEHALSLFPENMAANKAMGTLLASRGENPKRAKECLQRYTAANPKDLDALVAYAKALRIMGMVKNAQRVIEQAKEIDPRDARVVEEAKELKKAK